MLSTSQWSAWLPTSAGQSYGACATYAAAPPYAPQEWALRLGQEALGFYYHPLTGIADIVPHQILLSGLQDPFHAPLPGLCFAHSPIAMPPELPVESVAAQTRAFLESRDALPW